MHELPKHVITRLYSDFLFKDFLYMFSNYFKIKNPDWDPTKQTVIKTRKNKYFIMGEDEVFTNFMIFIL
jgi:hypothetical protein